MMLESNYKRVERIIVTIMILGIIAMFQPWFKDLVELFQPLFPEVKLGRTYTNEIAPVILRYGFFATFLSTVAFNVFSHYRVKGLQEAFNEKGKPLTLLLIALPAIYFFIILGHMAWAHYYAAVLGVVSFICAIAAWSWKRWGLIGIGVSALFELGLALSGYAETTTSVIILVAFVALCVLAWPKRTLFR